MVKMLKSKLARASQSIVKPAKSRSQLARIKGDTWMKIRDRILTRDQGLCVICRKAGVFRMATEVDHILPLEDGGSNDDDNLQSLDSDCHAAKTAAENTRRRNGG